MKMNELLPEIFFDEELITSEIELFQNKYLRAILKFQDPRFRLLIHNYCIEVNPKFNDLTAQRRKNYIDNLLQKNQSIRQQCIGIVIGLLEEEQFVEYLKNASTINSRILQMLRKRISS